MSGERHNFYAVVDNQLIELVDSIHEERITKLTIYHATARYGITRLSDVRVNSDSYFLVYDVKAGYLVDKIKLFSLRYANRIEQKEMFDRVRLIDANCWIVEDRIEFRVGPVPGNDDLFRLVPVSSLSPGAYAFSTEEFAGAWIEVPPMVIDFFVGEKPEAATAAQEAGGENEAFDLSVVTAIPAAEWSSECDAIAKLPTAGEFKFGVFLGRESARISDLDDAQEIKKSMERALEFYKEEDLRSTIYLCVDILKRDPLNWRARELLASALAEEHPEQALNHACEALKIYRRSNLYAVIAQCYMKLGNTEKALVWIDAALSNKFKASKALLDKIYEDIKNDPGYKRVLAKHKIT
jgi:tetratricopeptide (TPR) repeat protein